MFYAGHLLFNSGSNECSLTPQFEWLDNTFKKRTWLTLGFILGFAKSRRPSGRGSYIRARNSEQGISRDIPSSPPPLQSTLMNFLHKLCRKPHHFLSTNELCCGCDIFCRNPYSFLTLSFFSIILGCRLRKNCGTAQFIDFSKMSFTNDVKLNLIEVH
jgi:hypothetical protein